MRSGRAEVFLTAFRAAAPRAARAVLGLAFAAFLARAPTGFFFDLVLVFRAIDHSSFKLAVYDFTTVGMQSALLSSQTNMGCHSVLAPLPWGPAVHVIGWLTTQKESARGGEEKPRVLLALMSGD